MTHLGFVAASYFIAMAVPACFALTATRRLATARRRLAAIDPRAQNRE